MSKLVTYSSGTVSLPGHLWDRILDALGENSVAWDGEERSVKEEHAELIEELESLDHYLAAHGGGKTDTLPTPPVTDHPALKEAQDYCADAPDIVLGEGYWDDMENAYGCGLLEAASTAARIMRALLQAIGAEAPKGQPCCEHCDRMEYDGAIIHAPDCEDRREPAEAAA